MLFAVLLLITVAAAKPARYSKTEFVEKREALPTERVTFTLALRQRNVAQLKQMTLERSTPGSPVYGQWLSKQEVDALVAPDARTSAAVKAFLAREGITLVEDRADSLVVSAPASTVERVFNTNVTVFAHGRTGRELFKCNAYRLPAALSGAVEMLVGLPELPLRPFGPKAGARKARPLADYGVLIPGFLRQAYQVPINSVSKAASLCLVEFLDYASYDKGELATMLKETNNPSWSIPSNQTIGPFGGDGLETVLDVQYGGTMARGASVWLWTGQRWLLDWAQQVQATAVIPQVFSMSWGWPSNSMCAQEQGPGQCGSLTSQQYSTRVDTEFAKIAARGASLIGASGDQGAPGDNFYQCTGGLSDILPASSLWVTAVGATMIGSKLAPSPTPRSQPYGAPVCRDLFHPFGVKCADGSNTHEVTCTYPEALITSGGGFQAYFPMPSWQKTAVSAYLSKAKLPPSQYFNASNRAFPDVSAFGHNYLVFDSGSKEPVDGTSASTPVFAAIVTLLNAQRIAAGKSTLGHVAPLLYRAYAADPTIFNDITQGNNDCTESCCSIGFPATPGWDAATGLGSPRFPKLLKYVMSLP